MKRLLFFMLIWVAAAGLHAQEGLYGHFASRGNLAVAEVKGFRLNDSVKIDVVVVVADDAAAWQQLCRELNIRDSQGAVSWLCRPQTPAERVRWTGTPCCKAIASSKRRTVCFYHINNDGQYEALTEYQFNAVMR